MNAIVLFTLCIGLATSVWIKRGLPDFSVEVSSDNDGLVVLDLKSSKGLVCYNDGADNIAKVACGGSGSAKSLDNPFSEEDAAEFAMGMTCTGSEGDLNECNNEVVALSCDKFVGADCGAKRSMRGIL